jgi:putative ABC transport system permease protein
VPCWARLLALAVTLALLVFPVQMPPPPGRSVGYPLQIAADPPCTCSPCWPCWLLATVASALVARRTVQRPVVDALAHV